MKRATLILAVLAFLCRGAQATAGFVSLDDPDATGVTVATGISGNNIVGYGDRGFLYNGTSWTTLNDPDATGGTDDIGIDGSNIVGYYYANGYHGFLYNGASWTTLDDPNATNAIAGGTVATGISGNNIVGYYDGATGDRGFLYNGTSWTTLDDPNATYYTVAKGISGDNIVGWYQDGSGLHGFLYNGTSWTTLNDPDATGGTFATGISGNNIVGFYQDATGEHGFLYNGTSWTTLDDPNATGGTSRGTFAYGIDGGNIVGYYDDANFHEHGFLYTPNVATPEPSTLTLFGIGIVAIAVWRRAMRFAGSHRWRSVQLLCLAGGIVASAPERALAGLLVSSFGTNSVLEFDSATGAFIRTFASGGGLVGPEGLAYGPDGNLYVATRNINNDGIGGVLRFDGSTGVFLGTVIAPTLYDPFGITFGPNGNLYVSTDGPVGVGGSPQVLEYSVNAGGATLVAALRNGLQNPQAEAQGIAFGPDGRLYLATDAGGVKVYDASAGKFETFAAAPTTSTNNYDLAFSGSHLFVTDFNEVVSGIAYGRVLEYD